MEPIVRLLAWGVILIGGLGVFAYFRTWWQMQFSQEGREMRKALRAMGAEVDRLAREEPIDRHGSDWRIAASEGRWLQLQAVGRLLIPGLLCVMSTAAGIYAVRIAGQDWQTAGIITLCAGAVLATLIFWQVTRAMDAIQRLKVQPDDETGEPANLG